MSASSAESLDHTQNMSHECVPKGPNLNPMRTQRAQPQPYVLIVFRFAADAIEASQHPNGADPREVIRYAHQSTVMAGSSTASTAGGRGGVKDDVLCLGFALSSTRLLRLRHGTETKRTRMQHVVLKGS